MKKEEVLQANREFYNQSAAFYEKADGRRSKKLEYWLEKKLKKIAAVSGNDSFLDLGCGTGLMMKCAGKYFKKVVGVDVSPKILKQAKKYGRVVCVDAAHLPFPKNSFNVVAAFATLHHVFKPQEVFEQAFKVLKNNGCFYSDHDMEKNFSGRFKFFLNIYRGLRNPAARYAKFCPNINKDLHNKSEFHAQGLDAELMKKGLLKAGFVKINLKYHWYGLNSATDVIFGQKYYSLGLAPLLSMTACAKK